MDLIIIIFGGIFLFVRGIWRSISETRSMAWRLETRSQHDRELGKK